MRAYPKKLSALCHEQGILLIQAHPFREWMSRCDPTLLDGVEVWNGKDSPQERAQAKQWADENGLRIQTGGGDFHHTKKPRMGGILTECRIDSNETLVRLLRNGEFEIIRNPA